jgi:hypothetical protein
MSTSAKRPASEVEDSSNPSKRANTIEKSILSLLACLQNELQRRKDVKEKSFTNWVRESTYTSFHNTFCFVYLLVERKVGSLTPIAGPALWYSANNDSDIPWSGWLQFEPSKLRALLDSGVSGEDSLAGRFLLYIVVSLGQLGCLWLNCFPLL